MNTWHKRLMYLQILLLITLCFLNYFSNTALFIGLVVFTLLELGVLQKQRSENKEAVLYAKSCYFALLDLFFVLVLFGCFWFVFYLSITGNSSSYSKYLPALFIYILVRKYYIIKNYSYEK